MAGRITLRRLTVWFLLTFVTLAPCAAAVPWIPFGPDGGDARRLAVDPQDSAHIFLGSADGWVYASTTNGAHWSRLGRVGDRDDLVLDSIVVDPRDSKHLIVGAFALSHPDGGIFLSNDGGRTWSAQAEMRGQSVRSLAISALDPKLLVAGTLQGVFRSTDSGQHWVRISPEDSVEIHNVQSIAIDPKDPNVIYAGTWHLPWKTTDGGGHWDNIKSGIIDDSDVFSIIVDPKESQIVYASACSGIYKSTDSGGLFTKIQGIPSTARRTRKLLQDPNDLKIVFAGTTEGLFRSVDAGKQWTRTTGPELIVNDVEIDPKNSKHVLIATDRSGVMLSEDGGDTFQASNGGFSARQVTTMLKDRKRPGTLFVGVVNDKEWGGVFESPNGGINWTQRELGLEGRDVFSLVQAGDGSIIAGTSHGLYRLDSVAETWARIEGAPPVSAPGEPSHPAEIAGRPPVPVTRNQFARTGAAAEVRKPDSVPRTSSAKAVKLTPAKSKTRAAAQQTTRRKPVKGKPAPTKGRIAAVKGKARPAVKGRPAPQRTAGNVTKRVPAAKSAVVAAPVQLAAGTQIIAGEAMPASEIARAAPLSTRSFDGAVYAMAAAGDTLLAATSGGLLTSSDQGQTWTAGDVKGSPDWRFLAAAHRNVVAASLHGLFYSGDAGATWNTLPLPEGFTQMAALTVEPSGAVWVGGREGVFVSTDAGVTWVTPKNLFLTSVNSLYYDEPTSRVLVTTAAHNSFVFTVQLPSRAVTFTETGWNVRLVRPVGDHLVAATLYDGVVVQPKVMASPRRAPAQPAQTVPSPSQDNPYSHRVVPNPLEQQTPNP